MEPLFPTLVDHDGWSPCKLYIYRNSRLPFATEAPGGTHIWCYYCQNGFCMGDRSGEAGKKIKDLYLTEIWTRSFSRNDEDNCRYYLVDHGTAWPTHLFLADGVYNYGAMTSACRCGLSDILVSTTHRQSHALTCLRFLTLRHNAKVFWNFSVRREHTMDMIVPSLFNRY